MSAWYWYITFPLSLTLFLSFSLSSFSQHYPAGLRLTKRDFIQIACITQPHLQTYVDTHSHLHLSLNQCTHTHWHMQTPEQIKAYPPTVAGAPQDDEGSDPKVPAYICRSMADLPTSYSQTDQHYQLKAQPKALLQAACWIIYRSNDSPQKPRLCQLISLFFSLLLSLGLCHSISFFFFFSLSLRQNL